MSSLTNVLPKLFWLVVLAFKVVQSVDSDSVVPENGNETTLVICENGHDYIHCPYGTITIRNAYYGRTDEPTCLNDQIYSKNCKATTAAHIIRKKCENNAKCHLEATNYWFGDPCPNTYKYLRVDYTCSKDPIHLEHICESDSNTISCPEGKTIKIKNASYGRMDKDICPSNIIETINCRAEDSLSIVNERCKNSKECYLEASNNWFKDPCPGTYKYLSVEYQCVQDPIYISQTVTICESKTQNIKCQEGTSIIIEDAFYGRTDETTCPHQQIKDIQCKASNAFQIVNGRCNYKAECELHSTNMWFGDPCLGTYKYLQVKYKCVKDTIYKPQTVTICESKAQNIKCQEGTSIIIEDAFYGRTYKSICPHQQIKDTQCKGINAFPIVIGRCENKKECHLEASNNWFNDPCVGTYKYLSVDYRCVQDPIYISQTVTLCESKTQNIKCQEGTSIIIEDAFYGRTDESICPHQLIKDIQCKAAYVFQIVNGRCNHKTECELHSANTWFGDPCLGTYKYLQVKYKCVKEPMYKSHTVTICESKAQNIKCQEGTSIIIEDAFYGRTDKSICPHQQIQDIQCKASNAVQIVNGKCNHKAECELYSTNTWFGDPCQGTYKYLQVKYKCVKE